MVLICSGITWKEVCINIEAHLLSIKNWPSEKSLFLNFNKSVILLHSLSEHILPTLGELKLHEKSCKTLIEFQCKSVTIVKNYKYLGIEMYHEMK